MTKPLFEIPLPVIILSGGLGAGKTLFGLTICPQETLLFDEEESATAYEKQLSLKKRISMGQEMLKQFPGGYRPIDLYNWWLGKMRAVKPGEYRVIMIDPVSEIEDGLAEWVRANPKHFGATAAQYEKMAGLFWTHVKSLWKQIINEMAAKCEVVVMTVHMKNEWSGNTTTGRKIPKGKDTLEEMASLYLIMDRSPDRTTARVPDKPRAIVRKSRVANMKFVEETGDFEPIPILPPRLEIATPGEIRRYIAKGGLDYKKLREGEKSVIDVMTDEERLRITLETAQAQQAAEQAKLAHAEIVRANREFVARQSQNQVEQKTQDFAKATTDNAGLHPVAAVDVLPLPPENGTLPATADATAEPAPSSSISEEQIKRLITIKKRAMSIGLTEAMYQGILAKRGVTTAKSLNQTQAEELIVVLEKKVKQMEEQPAPVGAKSN